MDELEDSATDFYTHLGETIQVGGSQGLRPDMKSLDWSRWKTMDDSFVPKSKTHLAPFNIPIQLFFLFTTRFHFTRERLRF